MREDWQICPRSCVRSHVSCQSTDGQVLPMIFNGTSGHETIRSHRIGSKCAITEAMIELLDQHRYTLAGLKAVQKRLAKNKKTQAKLEADPTGSKSGFMAYLPGAQDLESVTESILQDSRAVSIMIAIAGREIKAIWWIEMKRYQQGQSNLLKRSMSVYAAMRVQLCKDASNRWSTMVKNLKCDSSAQFALTLFLIRTLRCTRATGHRERITPTSSCRHGRTFSFGLSRCRGQRR